MSAPGGSRGCFFHFTDDARSLQKDRRGGIWFWCAYRWPVKDSGHRTSPRNGSTWTNFNDSVYRRWLRVSPTPLIFSTHRALSLKDFRFVSLIPVRDETDY